MIEATIRKYYAAFNARDWDGMCALLAEDVAHDVCQGKRQVGRATFRKFLDHMDRCYSEQVRNLVVMVAPDGTHAAAEFDLDGKYLATDPPHPAARGQTYTLRVGAFFDIRDGRIGRVANHYNVADWAAQVR
ncbi:MAG: nuclear transport factor 2 family protein [Rhodospirillales bacterium]|nr:nuclear transport factor 2 family protein [Rhodospirillales bacterium]